ncbi:transposase [Methyloversatilis sp. XJ19-49]|uniref:transposase n=1 Tax=Methyloversatilis sp. XJ19-49 TaxID=2963429 RepID=UPI00359C3DAC
MEPRIRAVYDEHKERYGYRRITAALCNSMAEPVNHKCVQRLMQKDGAARGDPGEEPLPTRPRH